jgi:CubicO group peptidase (beta-lactamase class C family)
MKIKRLLFYLVCIICFVVTSCSRTTVSLDQQISDNEKIQWLENNLSPLHQLEEHEKRFSIQEAMTKYNVPGVSMVFVENRDIKWKKTYGFSNLQTSEKVSNNTVFTGASLSKPLTAVAALSLVETESLNLDEDVNKWLVEWKVPDNEFTKNQKVTLRHLISHRAGIRNDLWSSYLPEQETPNLHQMLAGQPPSVDPATTVNAIPGSKEQYSNPGYSIIQKLIEDVTQNKFEDVMDELIFKPSVMKSSTFQQPMPRSLMRRKATGYDQNLKPFTYKLFPYKAAGGVWTTPTDVAQFIITLFDDLDGAHKILSRAITQEIFSKTPIRLAFAKLYNNDSDDLVFRHYGTNQGFSSYIVGSLKNRQALIIMTNGHMQFEFLDYVARAAAEVYQWDYLKPIVHRTYASSGSNYQDYTGYFKLNDKLIQVSHIDNSLLLNSNLSAKSIKLTQIGPGEFFALEDSIKYQFLKDRGVNDGPFIWLRITSAAGREDYASRIE